MFHVVCYCLNFRSVLILITIQFLPVHPPFLSPKTCAMYNVIRKRFRLFVILWQMAVIVFLKIE